MQRRDHHSFGIRLSRGAAVGLLLSAILVGATGLSCDSDAMSTFRQTATGEIGSGVKTIVNGILDGWIEAIEQAGDGASSDSESSSTTTSS